MPADVGPFLSDSSEACTDKHPPVWRRFHSWRFLFFIVASQKLLDAVYYSANPPAHAFPPSRRCPSCHALFYLPIQPLSVVGIEYRPLTGQLKIYPQFVTVPAHSTIVYPLSLLSWLVYIRGCADPLHEWIRCVVRPKAREPHQIRRPLGYYYYTIR